MKNKVEAVLFASGRAMEESYLAQVTGIPPKELNKALKELQELYNNRESALFIWNEGTKWKINVREEHAELIKGIAAETEMTVPVMATLALIAFRSPILQADVIKSRGAGAYDHITELVDKEFITKEKEGRSYKIKLSDKFYNYFDVNGGDVEDAFKNVKSTAKQKKLGTLEVVNAETDDEAELEKLRRESRVEIYNIKEQRENDKGFLEEFEGRLDKVSERVDETEKSIQEEKNKYAPIEETAEKEEKDVKEDGDDATEKEEENDDDKVEDEPKNDDEEEIAHMTKRVEDEIDEISKNNS